MAEESKSQASRVHSEIAPSEQNSTNFNDQGQGQGQEPEPGQGQGQPRGRCMCNPCWRCCKGNLRQACFIISIIEIVFGINGIIGMILLAVVGAGASALIKTSAVQQSAVKPVPSTANAFTPLLVGMAINSLFLLGAGISLLLGAMKKFKIACLVHTVFSSLLTASNCFWAIASIYIIAVISGSCASIRKEGDSPEFLKALCELGIIITIVLVFNIISSLIWGTVYAYFAAVSTALYCHYKRGIMWEETKFCGKLCGGGNPNEVQPEVQYQSQSQSQNQNQNQQPKPEQEQEPAPEYSSKTEVKPNPKSTAKSKSRTSSNVNASKKTAKI